MVPPLQQDTVSLPGGGLMTKEFIEMAVKDPVI